MGSYLRGTRRGIATHLKRVWLPLHVLTATEILAKTMWITREVNLRALGILKCRRLGKLKKGNPT